MRPPRPVSRYAGFVGIVAALWSLWALWGAQEAWGYSYRASQFPNGSCEYCHIFPGGPRTSFGLQVQSTLVNGNVNWPAIFNLDADGDGVTNGEELGDPLGQWRTGDTSPPFRSSPIEEAWVPFPNGQAPVAQAASLTVNEDQSGTGTLRATDAENGTLAFFFMQQGQKGTGRILNWSTGSFRYTPSANANGTDTLTFVAWDGDSFSAPGTLTVTIRPVNDPPDVGVIQNQMVAEGQALDLLLPITDPDGDAPNVSVTPLPQGARVENGRLRWTPSFVQAGSYPLQVTATDAGGLSDSASFTVTVTNTPQPPQILDLTGDAEGNEGQTLAFEAEVVDPDGDALTYSWDPGDGRAAVSGANLSALSLAWPRDGAWTLTLTVSDGSVQSRAEFLVMVRNVPPTVDAGEPVVLTEGQSYGLRGSASDPGADALVYTWDFGDGTQGAGATPTHAWGDNGVFTATLRVSDGAVTVSDTVRVEVGNVAPSVDAGPNRSVVEGERVVMAGAFSDPGSRDTHSIAWTFGDGGTAQGSLTPTYAWTREGSFTATLRVTDDDGGMGSDSFLVTVANAPPLVDVGEDQMGDEGEVLEFVAAASDPGGDALSYAWDFGDGSPVVTGVDEVTHAWTRPGMYEVRLTVSDGAVSRTDSAFVVVRDVAPTVGALGGRTVDEGQTVALVAPAASEPGQGASALTYVWNFGDGSAARTGVGLTSLEHVWADDGRYTLSLRVEDGEGGQTTVSAQVEVRGVAPTIGALQAPTSGDEGQVLSFSATATDPGRDTLGYQWSFGDGSPPVSGAAVSRAFGDQGNYTVVLTVSDGDGLTTTAQRVVQVRNVAPTARTEGDRAVALGLPVVLRGFGSDPGAAERLSFAWDFDGDGDVDQQGVGLDAPTHTYAQAGVFTLRLTVTDKDGASAQATSAIRVVPNPPVVSLRLANAPALEGVPVTLVAEASDPQGQALRYAWDFGDGQTDAVQQLTRTHTYADQGSYLARVTVTDTDNISVSAAVLVEVGNAPPTVSLGDASVDEGSALALTATATDTGGDVLSYRWDFGDGTPTAQTQGPTVSHTYAQDGAYEVSLTVSDGQASGVAQATVTVRNVAPSVTLGGRSGSEGQAVALSAGVSDPGADALTYRWDFGDGSPVEATQGPTASHVYAQDGSYAVALTVSDGQAQTVGRATVTISNAPPTITPGPDLAGREGSEVVFVATARDAGADALRYTWNFGDGSAPVSVDSATVRHTYADDGVYTVTLGVSDGAATVTDTMLARISNVAPSVSAGENRSAQEGEEVAFGGTASDPGDDALTYCWSFGDGSPQRCGVGLAAPSYAWRQQGSYTVTLTVTDDGNARGSDTLRVDVRNAPPTVDAGGPILGREGEAVSFGPTVSDPGNDTLSYLWNFGDNTQPSTQARPAHTYRDDGVYEASVTVTDGTDATTAVVEVRVANVAPVVQAIAPVSADEGALVTLEARASDPGADALSYAWDFGDGNPLRGEGLGRVTRRFRDDPQGAGDGTFAVAVVVTDGDGGEATAVGEALIRNLPPTAEAGPAVQVAEGQEALLRGSATDPGSDVLTYAWDFGDGSPVEQGEGLSAPRHTYGAPGVYEVTLTVTDDDGASATDATTVTVSDVAPSARIELAPEFPREGEPVSLRVVTTGEPVEVEGLEWGFGDGSASVVGVDEVTHAWVDDGEFVVSVTLRDDEGTEAQVTRAVVVDNAAPSIESAPPRLGQRGVRYEYQASGVDPGTQDALTWRLQEAPEGMVVDSAGLVTWEPAVTEGVFPVVLVLADEDGGQTSQAWSVTVGFDDADEDGVPDDCERRYGLDPGDPRDADEDADGDGVSNRQECLRGSDPTQSGAPGVPSLDAPADGALVSLGGLRLVVNNASDPDGDALRYDFEVGDEPTLAQPLVREEGVAEQPSRTALDLRSQEALLEEDTSYWWRARACDASACGAWTRAYRFVRSDQDDAPSAPEARSPEGSVDEARPTLRAVAAVDPEGGAVTHRFEVFERAQPQTPVVVGDASEVVDGEVVWTLDEDLEDGVRYEWRVRGQDAQGQAGPWSARLAFEVNAANQLPPAPALVAPEDKAVVRSEGLALMVAHVDDPDGDVLVYRFRLARGERVTQAGLVAESEDITPDSRAVIWEPQGVEWVEDALYAWEAVAVDGEGEGEALRASFVLSDEDSLPPAPTLQSPSAQGSVQPGSANFVWLHAPDEEGGPIWYTVEILDGAGTPGAVVSSPPVRFEGAAGARVEWTTDALTDNTRYRWRVVGTDVAGNLGAFSETWDFVADAQPEAPTAPSLVSPVGGAQVEGGEGVALVWAESQDPEGAPVRYEVELDGPTSWSVEVDEAQATTPALEAGSWSWRVRALDGERASAWSDTGRFVVVGAQDEETPSVTTGKKDEGCAVGAGRAGGAGWAWAAVAALLWWSRRRRA